MLVALFLASAVVRVIVGWGRQTPLYYPDEYIYTALARSIAETGLPTLRGSALHSPSLLGPYLTAPFWLIADVGRAYHAVVAAGGVAFSAAVFPAYVIARRVGVSPGGGLVVALLSVLVPDAAFATTALTESLAYPLFLVTVLMVVDAIASPTRTKQAVAIALMAALCLMRVQFVVLPISYLIASVVREGGSWRRAWRQHPAVIGATVVAVVGAIAATQTFYKGIGSHWSAVFSMGPWFALDIFVLGIAAGWALLPAAVVGFAQLLKSPNPWRRAFAVLSLTIGVLIVLEAAYYDAILPRVHERYTFYVVPLIATACVFALQSNQRRRLYAVSAYTFAALAIILPATTWFQDADSSQAPTLLALQDLGTGAGRLAWALLLALVALALVQLQRFRWVPLALATVVAGALCIDGTRVLLSYAPTAHPGGRTNIDLYRLSAPSKSGLVTWSGTDSYVLMKTLFWTPTVNRVLVLGGGAAADGFGSQPVWFGARGLVDRFNRPVRGPFAFDLDTTLLAGRGSTSRWLDRTPRLLALGLNRTDRYLNTTSLFFVVPSKQRRQIVMVLSSDSGRKQLTFDCDGRKFGVEVGRSPVPVRVSVPSDAFSRCRISLTRGSAVDYGGSIVSGVRVTRLALVDARTTKLNS